MNLHLTLQSTSINASKSDHARLRASLRIWLLVFMSALVVSGLTAIPLEWELNILVSLTQAVAVPTALAEWIAFVHTGLIQTYHAFPFLAYGTDWLAFAHIVIAIAFIGPFKDPVKNFWVIEFSMIACTPIIPKALYFGTLR